MTESAKIHPVQRLSTPTAHWLETGYLAQRELVEDLRNCRSFARGRMLDVGCGNRPYREIFAAAIESYVGLDPDSLFSRPDVAGSASELPFAPCKFDTVLATQVIEHVPEPERMLIEISRVLKSGGHLILSAPQYWRLHESPHDYYRFTRYGLDFLIRKSGLSVVSIKDQGTALTVIGQALCNTLQTHWLWRCLIPLVNVFVVLVERYWTDRSDTLNYLVVARK